MAGITIVYVFGDNSIFKLAKDAKDKTEQAKNEEQEGLGKYEEIIDQYGYGKNPKAGPDKKGEILTANKTDYTDDTGTAVIPGGFCVVKNIEGDANTVARGLVISDVADDDLDNSKHGNQFVWVPVKDYSKFHLIEGYSDESLQTLLSENPNSAREAGDTKKAGSPGKPNSANSTAGSSESIAMYKSVKENKGFYIARFEVGIVGTKDNYSLGLDEEGNEDETKRRTVTDGSVKPLSQKGVGVWNSIPWGGTSSDKASDVLPGDDTKPGAVVVARSMYQKDGKPDGVHKVTSTLCYGVQWDAALKFIEPNYGEYNEEKTGYQVADNSYIKNSTGKGHYDAGALATTGSNTDYQQNHIYDMAGNVFEWTMEAYGTSVRVGRGGNYGSDGSSLPVSVRYSFSPGDSGGGVGARVALYL